MRLTWIGEFMQIFDLIQANIRIVYNTVCFNMAFFEAEKLQHNICAVFCLGGN